RRLVENDAHIGADRALEAVYGGGVGLAAPSITAAVDDQQAVERQRPGQRHIRQGAPATEDVVGSQQRVGPYATGPRPQVLVGPDGGREERRANPASTEQRALHETHTTGAA